MSIIQILDFIQDNIRSEFLDILMPIISRLGNSGIIWILTALILISTKKYRIDGITMIAALLMNLLISNIILKPLIMRVRPCDINTAVELLISRPTDYSFPSGHTSSSFAAATVIFFGNRCIGTLAAIFASAMAFSRLYLYVHYPSDILGGVVIGVTLGILARMIVLKVLHKIKS